MSLSRRAQALTAAAGLGMLGVGAGVGAGVYAALAPAGTTTIVQQVGGSGQSQPAAAVSGLSVNAVYQRTHEGVVDIVVDSNATSSSFGGQPFNFGGSGQTQAEGSGWFYDSKGDIVTNEHVVAGATKITVTLWNGKAFTGHVVGTDDSTDLAVVRISAPGVDDRNRSRSETRMQSRSEIRSSRSAAPSGSRRP